MIRSTARCVAALRNAHAARRQPQYHCLFAACTGRVHSNLGTVREPALQHRTGSQPDYMRVVLTFVCLCTCQRTVLYVSPQVCVPCVACLCTCQSTVLYVSPQVCVLCVACLYTLRRLREIRREVLDTLRTQQQRRFDLGETVSDSLQTCMTG
jgi:hypothetical protein